MMRRLPSLADLATLFGRDAPALEQKTASAEATGREVHAMNQIAQARLRANSSSFGIADPNRVTDLSAVLVPGVQATAENGARYRFSGRVEMSAGQWADILDNPRQRDTEAHARKAKHLRAYEPAHQFVSMAQLPDGTCYKLDGHTRSLLWSSGEVVGPKTVIVDVFGCDDIETAQDLYSKIDSQSAVETGPDKITGAARQHNLNFNSPLLKAGRYGTAVKRLYMMTARNWTPWSDPRFIYDAVGFMSKELLLLDQLNPQANYFTSGIVMAALATFKRRGREPMRFWTAYAENKGVKDSGRMDGVEALRRAVDGIKLAEARRRAEGGAAQQIALLGKGILAYESYRLGRTYTVGSGGGIRNMDDDVLKEYLRRSVEG